MNTRSTRTFDAARLIGLFALLPGITMGAGLINSTWTCTSGDFERKITLFKDNDSVQDPARVSGNAYACRVTYTKNGESEVLWLARNDPDYCEPKVLALVGKLQAAGFQCEKSAVPIDSADRSSAGTLDTDDAAAPPSTGEQAPPARWSDAAALRELLERHYEDSYLDAMVAAIPAGFSVGPAVDALSTQSGDVLYAGPPNHFVKTMADGSYVLVNTLVLQRDSMSSFVNLGFVVRDKRYRFLGYATLRSAVEAKVTEADVSQVTLMATTAATPSCEGARRMRTLRWSSDFGAESSQQLAEPPTGPASGSDCGD